MMSDHSIAHSLAIYQRAKELIPGVAQLISRRPTRAAIIIGMADRLLLPFIGLIPKNGLTGELGENKPMEQTLDECAFCGGSLHPKTLSHYDYNWGDKTYRFEGVPALVCAACGEAFFAAPVSQAMNQVVSGDPQPKRFEQLPVLSMPTV